jgi:hypothetical protein
LHSSKSMMMIIDKICMDIIFFWNILFQKKITFITYKMSRSAPPAPLLDSMRNLVLFTDRITLWAFTCHLSSEARVTFINSQRIFGALKHGIVPCVVSTAIWVLRPLNIVSMNWHSIYVPKSKIPIYL